jgi:hypothetical protein
MTAKNLTISFSLILALSACATTSFSPPSVNLVNAMETRGSNRSIGQSCKPFEKRESNQPVKIEQTVSGARQLIENFILDYRCRAHSAANGRQIFEIPSFLTAVGTVAATAFGAGPNVAIAGGTGASVFRGAKSYYSPKEKADIFDSSLDALLCVKLESVGIDAFDIAKVDIAAARAADFQNDADGGNEVSVSAQQRYFDLISASLMSVERVLAQRLSAVGVFDPAGVVAEIEKLASEIRSKEGAASQAAANNKATAMGIADAAGIASASQAIIKLDALRPKLETCVVRAKL